MDNATWQVCTDPQSMLDFVIPRASERKLILFGCLCCGRAAHLLTDPRHRQVVEAASGLADGRISEAQFAAVMEPVTAMWANIPSHQEHRWGIAEYMTAATRHLGSGKAVPWAAGFAASALACLAGPDESVEWDAARRAERAVQCDLLRELVGDPYQPFSFEPDWLAGEGRDIVEQARTIHDTERFDLVPRMADALERAGCQDQTVLEHCRRSGGHTPGCWVLDALLGQEPAVTPGLVAAADWHACSDLKPLLRYLQDKGSKRKWRLFSVACCLRIDTLITDPRSRAAVAVAARHADGQATDEELAQARLAAQAAQEEAWRAEYTAEAEANFCYTPPYAAACCRLAACSAARSAVCQDPRQSDAEPGSHEAERWRPSNADAVWAAGSNYFARATPSDQDPDQQDAHTAADTAEENERAIQCQILRDIFGLHFGPTEGEGIWLPVGPSTGLPGQQEEQWCRLPTPLQVHVAPEWLSWNVANLARAIYDEQAFDRLPILADALEEEGCADAGLVNHCRQPGVHVRGCWAIDLLLGLS